MKTDQDLIFEAYAKTLNEGSHLHDAEVGTLEEDDNDQYAPEEAPADDQALDIAPEEDDNVADDYPTHEEILSNIREIVDENIGYSEGREHSRETLNDIIDDLVQYRNGLPSTDDYMKGGKL